MKNKRLLLILLIIPVIFLIIISISKNSMAISSDVDQIHFIKSKSSDGTVIVSGGHCGLIDMMWPSNPLYKKNNDDTYTILTDEERNNVNTANFVNYYVKVNNKYIKIGEERNEQGKIISLNLNESFYYSNGTIIANYIKKIGCTNLDFVIMTHNHSDHIGGAREIADSGLVNNNTLVFYKEDVVATDENGTVVDDEENRMWYNHDFYLEAYNAFSAKTQKMCDVSKGCSNLFNNNYDFIQNFNQDPNPFNGYNTNIDYTYYFTFGNFKINLYNLYHIANHHENLNSIVTLITNKKTNKKTIIMGDQETKISEADTIHNKSGVIENPTNKNADCDKCNQGLLTYEECAVCEKGLENQIADIVGEVDVVRTGHHGYFSSNSYYMMNSFNPNYIISANDYNNDESAICDATIVLRKALYEKRNPQTKLYYTGESEGAIVVDMSTSTINVDNYDYNATKSITTLTNLVSKSDSTCNGLYSVTNINFNDRIYMYYLNGQIQTGWQTINNNWYYFDSNGLDKTGWIKLNNDWYYMDMTGQMQKSWVSIKSKWYYMNDSGVMQTGWQLINNKWYYMNDNGVMQTGWQVIDNRWYYFNEIKDDNTIIPYIPEGAMATGWLRINDYWYYLTPSTSSNENQPAGSLQTGWQVIDNRWYYFNEIKDGNTIISDIPEGAMATGFKNLSYGGATHTCYFYEKTSGDHQQGQMATGWQKISSTTNGNATNYWYYFSPSKIGNYFTGSKLTEIRYPNNFDSSNGIIYNLEINTKYTNVINNIITEGTISIKDKDNAIVSTTQNIKTSDTISISLEDNNQNYKVSVLGDVVGNGKIAINDVAKTYSYLKGKTELASEYIKAADVTHDGEVRINDIAKLYGYIKGKVNNLN